VGNLAAWPGRSPRRTSRRRFLRLLALLVAPIVLAGCAIGSSDRFLATASADAGPSGSINPAGSTAPAVSATAGVPPATAERTPAASGPTLGAAPLGPTERAIVLRVIDGDTIEVDRGHGLERVRYIGIDTPETVDPSRPVAWMGPEASKANAALVEGRTVFLERDVSETDRYGRLLRYVWIEAPSGWLLVNLALVAAGFAQVSTYPPDVRYVELFLAAQAEARAAERGLWGPGPSVTPGSSAASTPGGACDPSYPTVCIPPPPPDLDCGAIPYRRFKVLPPDPHRFDGDHDGIGCESG